MIVTVDPTSDEKGTVMTDLREEPSTPPEAELAMEAEDLDVPQADAEAVDGGCASGQHIGSATGGAGAGKVSFDEF